MPQFSVTSCTRARAFAKRTGRARHLFRPQLFSFHRVKLNACVESHDSAVPAARTPARGGGPLKRVSSRQDDLRQARPSSVAGMIFLFILATSVFAGPYLL